MSLLGEGNVEEIWYDKEEHVTYKTVRTEQMISGQKMHTIATSYTTHASTTSLLAVPPVSIPFGALPPISVKEGLVIHDPASGRQAQVDHSFIVVLSLMEEGYLATSNIADLYEIGETASEARSRYFASLVDELLWFQKHERTVSAHLLRIGETLRSYIYLL